MKKNKHLIFIITLFFFYSCKEATGILEPKKSLPGYTPTPAAPTDKGYSYIFVTNIGVDATGSSSKDGLGTGLASFDARCNTVAAEISVHFKMSSGKYKALINTSTRRACYSADCGQHGKLEGLDWPLAPNREYRRPSLGGNTTVVGTTNELGLFSFPLDSPVYYDDYAGSATPFNYLSGFATGKDWTGGADNCDDFTKLSPSTDGGTFVYGDAGAVSTDFLDKGATGNCSDTSFGHNIICVEEYTYTPGSAGPDGDFGVIFTTTQTVDGTGATAGDGSGSGVGDFDAVCASEATGHGLSGTFKAILDAGGTRRACHSAGCATNDYAEGIDWPMPPNKEYRQLDRETVIGTTNDGGVFDFPITDSIDGSSDPVWGGFNATKDWRGSGTNCTNFTSTTGTTSVSKSNLLTNQMLNDGSTSDCNQSQKIMCAREYAKPTQAAHRVIFMTASNYTAGSPYLNQDGPLNFDAICASEALSKGLNIEKYKAFIQANADSGKTWRRACYTAGCADGISENRGWVLGPNMEYRREDGTTVIGTTNGVSIFPDPLDNSFTGTADLFWTGFTESFAILNAGGGANNCLNFTYLESGGNAYCGLGNVTTGNDVYRGGAVPGGKCRCIELRKVLCVEQTR